MPDVVVLAGTRILGKRILSSVPCPIVNIHAGITPLYRGVHGAYWALVDRRPDLCGVTVHRVDEGIDTGNVLAQVLIDPTKEDNFASYPWLQMGAGLTLLTALLPRIAAGENIKFIPLSSQSKLRHHPTIWGYLLQKVP
jgi:methionyl-tRNA formyltransferase